MKTYRTLPVDSGGEINADYPSTIIRYKSCGGCHSTFKTTEDLSEMQFETDIEGVGGVTVGVNMSVFKR